MPDPGPKPGARDRALRPILARAGLVGVLAVLVFAYRLPDEPHFADESAYLSQSYFADLWLKGATDDPAWLTYPAYDLPPLPKYMIGLALRVGGYRRPPPSAARAWYANTSLRFDPPGALTAARWPSVLSGALGCVAIYGLGVLECDRRAGTLTAVLLMFNPLYRLHARRAMSDVPAEALILLTAVVSLWAWRRLLSGRSGPAVWLAAVWAGFCGGLAALAKLNGALAMIFIIAWTVLTLALPRIAPGTKVAVAAMTTVSGVVSLVTFAALNPFLTSHPGRALPPPLASIARMSPWERARLLVIHRMAVPREQKLLFPHNALHTPLDQLAVVAVQGFGRFGPLGPRHSDSTRRFDPAQDGGALIWAPCVAAGAFWALAQGRRQWNTGRPPTAWAVLVAALVALLTVTAYLPLAWDRYFLSIQPGAALLASGAAVVALDWMKKMSHVSCSKWISTR